MGASDLPARLDAVDFSVKGLEVGQISRIEAFDDGGADLVPLQVSQAGDNPGQEKNDKVGTIPFHPRVFKRQNLIPCKGQPHGALSMDSSIRRSVSLRKRERELRFHGRAIISIA